MSNYIRFKGARRCGFALAVGFASLAVPAAAQAAPVDLSTASPFVALEPVSITASRLSVAT